MKSPRSTALKPTVAIFYSPVRRGSGRKDYATSVRTLYTAARFHGQHDHVRQRKAARIGRRQRSRKLPAIVLPLRDARHQRRRRTRSPKRFRSTGGTLVAAGDHCLAFDEYNKPREGWQPAVGRVAENLERDAAADLRKRVLKIKPPCGRTITDDKTNDPTWGIGIQSRRLRRHDALPGHQHAEAKPVTVNIATEKGDTATDLLTGQSVSLEKLVLDPMSPMLLKIGENESLERVENAKAGIRICTKPRLITRINIQR